MYIYIISLIVVWVIAAISKRKKYHYKYFVFIAFFIMTLLLGLRGYSVGEDTEMYINIAQSVEQKSWKEIFSSFPTSEWNYISYGFLLNGYSQRVETIFMAYVKLIMIVFHNAQWVLILTALITNFFMAKFILDNGEDRDSIIAATYVYMCDALFMNSFNIMRQILAISIAAQSVKMIKNGENKRAVLCVVMASTIHLSMLVFLIADVILMLKNKAKKYWIYLVGIILLQFLVPLFVKIVSLLLPKYKYYFIKSYWSVQLGGTLVLWIIVALVIFVMVRSKKANDMDWWLIYIATLYIGIEILGLRYTAISRVAMSFRLVLVLLLPSAKKYFGKRTANVYELVMFIVMTLSYISYANSPARYYSFFL